MNLSELPDAALLRRYRASRSEAEFTELLRRYQSLVLGAALRILENRADAEDASQAAFVALAIRTPRLEPDRPLGPWLHVVAVRAALDLRKSRERRILREAIAAQPTEAPPASDFQRVDALLAKLPKKLSAPLVAHYLEGRTIAEIARRERCPESTVSMRLVRGRQRLRKWLGSDRVLASITGGAAVAASEEFRAGSRRAAACAWGKIPAVEPRTFRVVRLARRALRPAGAQIVASALVVAAGCTLAVIGFAPALPTPASAAPSSGPKDDTRPLPTRRPGFAQFDGWKKLQALTATIHMSRTGGNVPTTAVLVDQKGNQVGVPQAQTIGPGSKTTVRWREDRDGRFYQQREETRNGTIASVSWNAWNGSVHGRMHQAPGQKTLLNLSQALPVQGLNLAEMFPLDPLVFLLDPKTEVRKDFVGLKELTSSNPSLARATGEPARFGGQDALLYAVDGPSSHGPARYRVYFSTADSRLLGWECRLAAGELFCTLAIERWSPLAGDAELEYPAQYTVQYFAPAGPAARPAPTFGYRYTVELTPAGGLPAERFTVDSNLADLIYDADTKKLTRKSTP